MQQGVLQVQPLRHRLVVATRHHQGDATGTAANGPGHMEVRRRGRHEGRLETNTVLRVVGDDPARQDRVLRGDVTG
jgi:hypothetical protein